MGPVCSQPGTRGEPLSMWKSQNERDVPPPPPVKPAAPIPPAAPLPSAAAAPQPARGGADRPTHISKTVLLKGSITGNEDLYVEGKLDGNVSAGDRVEIKAQGALTGDVSAARISIEDGAFFKGGIDIRKGAASAKA